jgi:predicted dehydrogenase
MTGDAARKLVYLAKASGLYLGAAPCSLLSETAQTLGKAIRDGVIGKVRLVYANFDDGMIAPVMRPWSWLNDFGAPWPAKDEFEVGCTFEHAGYVLTWLGAFFGPARRVTSFASTQLPDKGIAVEKMAPDFTVGCIEYDDAIVARVTCGLIAPKDKSLTIVGDTGVLHVRDVRNDAGPVFLRRPHAPGFLERVIKRINRSIPLPVTGEEWGFQTRLPLLRQPTGGFVSAGKPVDFCRGPAEMASAIRQNRPSRLSAEFAAHITEIVEALQNPQPDSAGHIVISSFNVGQSDIR